jgi:shikimate 5-dehydrogenase
MTVVNRSAGRLEKLQKIVSGLETEIEFRFVHNANPQENDRLMEILPEGSVVINATGLGKDMPGSPITNQGLFPMHGVAWEINYRGELDFWHQAMAQKDSRQLLVEDGWLYFIYGWTEHVTEALDIDLEPALFERLAKLAESFRPPLVYRPREG